MALPPTPKIAWGTSFANTWTFPGPVDTPLPDSAPVGHRAQIANGESDFWKFRRDEVLQITVPFIPKDDAGSVTGWATATTGVREFKAWAEEDNEFRYYPDKDVASYHTCKLVEPVTFERTQPGGSHYRVTLKFRDTSGTAFTEY